MSAMHRPHITGDQLRRHHFPAADPAAVVPARQQFFQLSAVLHPHSQHPHPGHHTGAGLYPQQQQQQQQQQQEHAALLRLLQHQQQRHQATGNITQQVCVPLTLPPSRILYY